MQQIHMKNCVKEKFYKYISIDTQSDDSSNTFPSTKKQFDLLNLLYEELKILKLSDVTIDEKGYVMGTLPANNDKPKPVIGFIAHVDTSPDMSGENIKPQEIINYKGDDIKLNNNLFLTVNDFPELLNYVGQTIITTDGSTLLGADDKAGVAEIMTAIEYLVKNPEIKHGTIRVGFTPDEEIGKGVDFFDVSKFGADWAYTIDGGEIGELEYENFNAASATIKVQGRNIHPGYAKGKMRNAILMAMQFNDLLPTFDKPEFTQNYEGFFHLIKIDGNVEKATLQYIIRDHNKALFDEKKNTMIKCINFLNDKYKDNCFEIELKDQYYNMREKIEPTYHIIETAAKAMKLCNVKPIIKPIRGGTDGARLSFMGLPCPNIFAGGHNFHGKFEFVPLESMEKATQVILKIIELNK